MVHGTRRLIGLITLFLAVFLAHAGAAACDVRVNEFCAGPGRDWDANGTFSARDDEWIELVNTGLVPVDLSIYMISDADSTIRWGGTGLMNPGEHRVVFGSDAVTWQHDNGRTVAGFSLANAGDGVKLWQVQGADTVLVEGYTYRAHEAATDRAVGRNPDGTGETWSLFDGLNPYTGTLDPRGTACNPTPHSPNQCDTTPADNSTWGRIKATYR